MNVDILEPKPWLVRPRLATPKLIFIHATRGSAPAYVQYSATRNWLQVDSNQQENFAWGSSCNYIVGNEPGEITLVKGEDYQASWGVGYGNAGTWGGDVYGFSIEVAQSSRLETYDNDAITNLLDVCEYLCRKYDIKPVRIPYLSQQGIVPSGIVGHEDTANGRKTGKSDPGSKFPWDSFITTLQKRLAPKVVLPTKAEVERARMEFGTAAQELWVRNPDVGEKWYGRELEAWREKHKHLFR